MRTRRTVVAVVTVCSLLLAAGLLPAAAEERLRPHAEMALGADRIDWQPAGDAEQVVLTIAGPEGLRLQKEFAGNQPISLSLVDQDGNRLPEGAYIFELRLTERNSEQPRLQAGTFVVRNGGFAAPFEPAQERKAAKEPAIKNVTAQDVIPDDLCVGALCASGDEGPQILKLKNYYNVGIRFEDVVDGFSYSRDWILQANPNLGGPDYFFLQDVDAGTVPFSVWGDSPDYSLVVGSGGKIGIGTTIPSVRLEVKTSAAGQSTERLHNSSATGYSGTEYLDNAGNVDLYFGLDNAASTTRLNSVNNNPIVILTNHTERMRVTSTGNVGIGTASPAARLEVSGGEVRFPPGAGAAGFTHFNLPADGRNYIRGTTIIADNAGSVGIGTASPSSRLHVNGGDIRVSGGSFIDDGTTLNVPDYVFEPGYRLMPLDELREFVEREKHLPNVPSADDVKKEGLNLSQVQMRLLEKLEELTLYTLKQDEEIKVLRARLEELEKMN